MHSQVCHGILVEDSLRAFASSTVWVLEIELRSSGLAASTFPPRCVLLPASSSGLGGSGKTLACSGTGIGKGLMALVFLV